MKKCNHTTKVDSIVIKFKKTIIGWRCNFCGMRIIFKGGVNVKT